MLVCVPAVNAFESPSSWISRLALSQSANLKQILDLFQVVDSLDVDIFFTQNCIDIAEIITGIRLDWLKAARDMLSITNNLEADNFDLLLYSDRGNPRYRYCPVCMHESRIKSFDFNWRYNAWRWCPKHDCLMIDKCEHCNEYIELSRSMITAGKDREGVAYLDRCLKCGGRLSKKYDDVLHPFKDNLLSEFEKFILINGRAFLSAIYNKRFFMFDNKKAFHVNDLDIIYKMGIIPSSKFEFKNENIELRLQRSRIKKQ